MHVPAREEEEDDDDDEEGWLNAPVEPRFAVDVHPVSALEGLLLPPSAVVSASRKTSSLFMQ